MIDLRIAFNNSFVFVLLTPMSSNDEEIRLGFAEEVDSEFPLIPETFPNKVGGKPVFHFLRNNRLGLAYS